ncbi:MAG: tetratricopeptide repeat protein [Candidatus Methylomirabilales bacterium]
MRRKGVRWCGVFVLCLGLGLLLPHPGGEAKEAGRGMRVLLLPFWGPTGPAAGAGLGDLLGFCLSRVGRVHVLGGRKIFQSLQWNLGWRGLVIGEATELGQRHRAHVVLLIRYALQEDHLAYQVSLGDLRGKPRWRQFSLSGQSWSEAYRLHLRLAREILDLLDPPLLTSEARRTVTACGRPFPSQEALALHGEARLKEWEGDGETAITIYGRAGEAASGFALPFFRQGELFEALGSRWRAAGAYRRAVQVDGQFVEAYKRLGDLLAENPRRLFEQALVAYQRAVEIDPDYAGAYVGLADTSAALGKVDEAIREYGRALSADPWNIRAHLGLAHIYYAERGLFHEAVAEYEQALALDPDFVEAHFGLGDMLEEKGLYQQAISRYEHVLDLKPGHTGALFAVARAYEKVDVPEAIARWEQYLRVASAVPSEREWLDIARGHLERLRRLEQEKLPVRQER